MLPRLLLVVKRLLLEIGYLYFSLWPIDDGLCETNGYFDINVNDLSKNTILI